MPAQLTHHKLLLENGESVEWKRGEPPKAVKRKGRLIKVVSHSSFYRFLVRALKKA